MEKLEKMLLGAFVGDAFALGPHWIYDIEKIRKSFGNIDKIVSPLEDSYHKGKIKGDFTHYGDQMLILMNYLSKSKEYVQQDYRNYWLEKMEGFKGYMDHASKNSIVNLKDLDIEIGSDSNELAGIAGMPLLLFVNKDNKEILKKRILKNTSLTHGNKKFLEIVETLFELTYGVLDGKTIIQSLDSAFEIATPRIKKIITKARESLNKSPEEAALDFGQSCHSGEAFPLTIYLLLKYENSFRDALINNVMIGGDSAARGIVLGMIMGATEDSEIPNEWIEGMNYYTEIKKFIL